MPHSDTTEQWIIGGQQVLCHLATLQNSGLLEDREYYATQQHYRTVDYWRIESIMPLSDTTEQWIIVFSSAVTSCHVIMYGMIRSFCCYVHINPLNKCRCIECGTCALIRISVLATHICNELYTLDMVLGTRFRIMIISNHE